MNNTTISLKEMINYIWEKKIFLIIWIIIISSVFGFFTFKTKPQFNAKINYSFPKSEIPADSMSDVLDFLQRGKTFTANFQWLKKAIEKNLVNIQFKISNNNNRNVSISLISENPDNLEKDILNFINKIDSLFIEEKLSDLLVKRNEILDQIENLNIGENSFEKKVIIKKLNEMLEKLIIEEYSLKNLTKESVEKVIIEDKTVSKNLLIIGSIVFSIWSGLMIVIIKYFFR